MTSQDGETSIGKVISLDSFEAERLRTHLDATMAWLRLAQDMQVDGGVSAGYTVLKGWAPSFPETTGYIVPSFLNYSTYSGVGDHRQRAFRMVDWLLTVQNADGSFPGGVVGGGGEPSVFNTGQIIFGLVRAAQVSGDDRYLAAARRSGDWLASVQDQTGEWSTHDFLGKSHVYNTRTAWALLVLNEASPATRLEIAASRNLDWALSQCDEDGFYDRAAFDPLGAGEVRSRIDTVKRALAGKNLPSFYAKASLHAVAYTIQGVLECSWLLGRADAEGCALKGAEALAEHIEVGALAGFYAPGWRRETSSWCLTGVAQMAVVWLRLAQRGRIRYVAPADRAIRVLQDVQDIHSRRPERRGAVAGSKPLYGLYLPFRFPNWAAKFAVDAYLLRIALAEQSSSAAELRVW